jgi:hypothetical protein
MPLESSPETPVMTAWPTIGEFVAGRIVGRLSSLGLGWHIFTLGHVFALATIPLTLCVWAWKFMPVVCRRYALTDRRIIVQKGLSAVEGPSIRLDAFDAIDVRVLPGQEWLHAGDLIFRRNGEEVFRLAGVSRPEVFRRVCLKARTAEVSVRRVIEEQAA